MNRKIDTTVRHLQVHDTFVGSGFVVTERPFTSVRCPRGKINVAGFYPGKAPSVHQFNPNTTVRVLRDS